MRVCVWLRKNEEEFEEDNTWEGGETETLTKKIKKVTERETRIMTEAPAASTPSDHV